MQRKKKLLRETVIATRRRLSRAFGSPSLRGYRLMALNRPERRPSLYRGV